MTISMSRKRKFRRAAVAPALLPEFNASLTASACQDGPILCDSAEVARRQPAAATGAQTARGGRGSFALHALVLSVSLFVGAGGLMVHARQPRAEAPNMQAPLLTGQIGSVDIERVYVASGGPEQLSQRATEIATEVAQRFNDVKGVPQLDQNELSEYGTLLFRATRTEADQARLKALKALSDQRVDELNRLQIKPDAMLTVEDKARMRQLQEQGRQFQAILPNWQDDLRGQQTERVEAFRRTQMARLRPLIGKLAQERGIAHVFDSAALVYSANDLTPALLQRVSKRAPRDKDAKDADTKEKDAKETP